MELFIKYSVGTSVVVAVHQVKLPLVMLAYRVVVVVQVLVCS